MAKTTVVPVQDVDCKTLKACDYIQYKITDTVLSELKKLHERRGMLMRQLQAIDEKEARILASFR